MFKIYSYIFAILGLFSLLAYGVEYFDKNSVISSAFLISGFCYFFIAAIARVPANYRPDLDYTNIQLLFLWSFISLSASLPIFLRFYLDQAYANIHFLSAVFEATSGVTSTGLTVLELSESAPRSLFFWRSSLQWLGGLGIVVWVSLFLRDTKLVNQFSTHEIGLRMTGEDKYENPQLVLFYYLGLSIILIFLLIMAGMTPWEAINYGMTISSTGGFGVYQNSFESFTTLHKCISIVFMILAASNLYLFANSLRKLKPMRIFRSCYFRQFLFLFFSIEIFSIAVHSGPLGIDFIFNITSAITTTGLNAEQIEEYSPHILVILSFCMFLGAMTGSTAGGLRQKNIFYFLKGLKLLILNREFEEQGVEVRENIRKSFLAIFSWFLMIIASVILVSYFEDSQASAFEIFFNIVSALTNCGLSLGMIKSASSDLSKFIFIILMIVGRINISSLIILATLAFRKLRQNK